ncbi:MAG: hypothetical protein G8237_04180 [Magnetococcales bacterium]|nr:hypothetical protein [Magnetococcales bacterium]NGZ05532.1 hypothetical protein [Magnetococcales bacterium]
MAADWESWESRLTALPRLVRERRLDDAASLLDGLIAASPELAARVLVLARFVALEPERWDREMQSALGQFGGAPLAAYRRAMRVLDDRRANDQAMERLHAWSAAWNGGAVALPVQPHWVETLRSWSMALHARRALWRLDGAERQVMRLERLAERLAHPPCRDVRIERIVARLTALRRAWEQ